jgi:predicted anti-sigma-YlaC factor YlaD
MTEEQLRALLRGACEPAPAPALDDRSLVLELERRRMVRRSARRWAIAAVLVAIALVIVFVMV